MGKSFKGIIMDYLKKWLTCIACVVLFAAGITYIANVNNMDFMVVKVEAATIEGSGSITAMPNTDKYGSISSNYMFKPDANMAGQQLYVHYLVTDISEPANTFYEGTDRQTVSGNNILYYSRDYDDLLGYFNNQKYYVSTWVTRTTSETEEISGYAKSTQAAVSYDMGNFLTQDSGFSFDKTQKKHKVTVKTQSNVSKNERVCVWIRNENEHKYTRFENTINSGKNNVSWIIDFPAEYNAKYYGIITLNGRGVAKEISYESIFKPSVRDYVYGEDGIGIFDYAFNFRLGYSEESTGKSLFKVKVYYCKSSDTEDKSEYITELQLSKENDFSAIVTTDPKKLLEPNTDYYVYFIDSKEGRIWRHNFKTKPIDKAKAKITAETEIDSAKLNIEIPSGIMVDEKYVSLNRPAYIFLAKKGESYDSTPTAVTELKYTPGKWTSEGIKITSLEENTEYSLIVSLDNKGQKNILTETAFSTKKELRTIVMKDIDTMVGGFRLNLFVKDPGGIKTTADDVFVSTKMPGDLVWSSPKKPVLNEKELTYSYDIPVDKRLYNPGEEVEYKVFFQNRSKYSVEAGIVSGKLTIPVDNRTIKVISEKTYRDAHKLDLQFLGLKSYKSYLTYFARVKDGEWKNLYYWEVDSTFEKDKTLYVFTDEYEVGDEVEYVLGYVDDLRDVSKFEKAYSTTSGKFTVLSDDRSVVLKAEPTATTNEVYFYGEITGAGRYKDYDYIKLFYREKGDSDTFDSTVLTLYPDEKEFNIKAEGLQANTVYEYVVGVAGYSNATVSELMNTPCSGTIKTKKDENSLTLLVKDSQPVKAVPSYNVIGSTVEIKYKDVDINHNQLALYVEENLKSVSYSTSDSKVVTADGKGVVTIKGPGIAKVTAKSRNMSGSVTIKVIDYKPVLQSDAITVYQGTEDSSCPLGLYMQNGAEITSVEIRGKVGTLIPVRKNDIYYIKAAGYSENAVERVKIIATINDGTQYEYDLIVRVDVSKPEKSNFTIRQKRIPNVFYGGDDAEKVELSIKSSKYEIESIVSKIKTDVYVVDEFDSYNGKIVLKANNLSKERVKRFIEKEPITLTIKAKNYAAVDIKLQVDVQRIVPVVRFGDAIIDEASKTACVTAYINGKSFDATGMSLNPGAYPANSANVSLTTQGDKVKVKLNNARSGSYKADVAMPNWTTYVVVQGNVNYLKKNQYASFAIVTDPKNITINTSKGYNKAVIFNAYIRGNEKLAANISAKTDSKNITVMSVGTGGFEVRAKDGATGSAQIKLTGNYAGTTIRPYTITVKLTTAHPDIKLSAQGKINIPNRENTPVIYTPKLQNMASDVIIGRASIASTKVTVDGKLSTVNVFKPELVDGKIYIYGIPGMKIYPKLKYSVTLKLQLNNGQSINKDIVIVPDNNRVKPKRTILNRTLYKTNKQVSAEYELSLPPGYEISAVKVYKKNDKDTLADNFAAKYEDGILKISLRNNGAMLKRQGYNINVQLDYKDADNSKPYLLSCPVMIR